MRTIILSSICAIHVVAAIPGGKLRLNMSSKSKKNQTNLTKILTYSGIAIGVVAISYAGYKLYKHAKYTALWKEDMKKRPLSGGWDPTQYGIPTDRKLSDEEVKSAVERILRDRDPGRFMIDTDDDDDECRMDV